MPKKTEETPVTPEDIKGVNIEEEMSRRTSITP